MSSPALLDFTERSMRLDREAREGLHVPETAILADIIVPVRGKVCGIRTTQNANMSVSVYADRDGICIATAPNVVRIPLDRIEEVACIGKKIPFLYWNKVNSYDADIYKKYKIRTDGTHFFVKPYYAVYVRGSERFVFLIPPYEFENFAPLLGGKAMNVIERKSIGK